MIRLVPLVALLGCATPRLLPDAQLSLTHGDARIGTYVSKGWGFLRIGIPAVFRRLAKPGKSP